MGGGQGVLQEFVTGGCLELLEGYENFASKASKKNFYTPLRGGVNTPLGRVFSPPLGGVSPPPKGALPLSRIVFLPLNTPGRVSCSGV